MEMIALLNSYRATMANQRPFKGFQVLQPGLQYIYTTKQIQDYVKTQMLLGMKDITIDGTRDEEWEVLLNLKELGILKCDTEFDYQNQKQIIKLKLK